MYYIGRAKKKAVLIYLYGFQIHRSIICTKCSKNGPRLWLWCRTISQIIWYTLLRNFGAFITKWMIYIARFIACMLSRSTTSAVTITVVLYGHILFIRKNWYYEISYNYAFILFLCTLWILVRLFSPNHVRNMQWFWA